MCVAVLAQVNILSSMLFAGLSGSAVADTSALGSMLIPAMEKNGYTRRFAAAVTAASSVIGPIIPPSGIMIIYAYVMEVSVAALFAGGIIPGILVGVGLMGVVSIIGRFQGLPITERKATWSERAGATRRAILPLMTPVIILGGILGGIFTPTEASAVAAAYALIIGLFVLRTLKFSDLPQVFTKSALTASMVLLLVGAAMAFKTVVSLSHAAEELAQWIITLSTDPLILLFLINVLLFIVGMFLDAGPAIIILGPILVPIFTDIGPLRHHHERQPDRRTGDTAHGTCAVRRLECVRRAGRDHIARHIAVPRRRDPGHIPDYLRSGRLDGHSALAGLRLSRPAPIGRTIGRT